MIKTFRGLMATNTQDTIVLHTNDGSTGYQIVKFEVINYQPGTNHTEIVMKIYKTPPNYIRCQHRFFRSNTARCGIL